MRREGEVRGSPLGLLACLGRVTLMLWLVLALLLAASLLSLIWAGPPYGLAVGLGVAQLVILFWGDRASLRGALKRRFPEDPPASW